MISLAFTNYRTRPLVYTVEISYYQAFYSYLFKIFPWIIMAPLFEPITLVNLS